MCEGHPQPWVCRVCSPIPTFQPWNPNMLSHLSSPWVPHLQNWNNNLFVRIRWDHRGKVQGTGLARSRCSINASSCHPSAPHINFQIVASFWSPRETPPGFSQFIYSLVRGAPCSLFRATSAQKNPCIILTFVSFLVSFSMFKGPYKTRECDQLDIQVDLAF